MPRTQAESSSKRSAPEQESPHKAHRRDPATREGLVAAVKSFLADGEEPPPGVTLDEERKHVTAVSDVSLAEAPLVAVLKQYIVAREGSTLDKVASNALTALRIGLRFNGAMSVDPAAEFLVQQILEAAALLQPLPSPTALELATTVAAARSNESRTYRGSPVIGLLASLRFLHKRFVPGEAVPLTHLPVANNRVTVVVGTSGSGKTDAMLTLGSKPGTTLTVYVRADDLNLGQTVPQLEKRADPNAVSKDAIDNDVAAAIRDFVKAEVGKLKRAYAEAKRGYASEEHVKIAMMTSGSVRLVIDETGSYPEFVRSVIRGQDKIQTALQHEDCLCLEPKQVSIEIMVGGTGSASPDKPIGSLPERYFVCDMDGHAAKQLQDGFVRQLPGPVQRALQKSDAQVGATERLEFLAMLTNARLGALVVQWFKLASIEARQKAVGVPFIGLVTAGDSKARAADELNVKHCMRLAVSDAIVAFRNLNGLSVLEEAAFLDTLATAMTITVLGCDKISEKAPIQRKFDKEIRHDDGEDDDDNNAKSGGAAANGGGGKSDKTATRQDKKEKLQDQLVTKFGVLRDRALRRLTEGDDERVIGNEDGSGEVLVVPDDGRGRFEMPDAYRAMYLRQLLGPPEFKGAQFEQLEELLWRQAAALAPCVTMEHSLWQLLLTVNAGYIESAKGSPRAVALGSTFTRRMSKLCRSAPPVYDAALAPQEEPSLPWQVHLVRATAHYPCAGNTNMDDLLAVLANKRFTQAKRHGAVLDACRRDSHFRWPLPLRQPSSDAPGGFPAGHTAVLLNCAKAPCSDVIVADARRKHNELIGIAAKLYPQSAFTETMHLAELAKWGDGDAVKAIPESERGALANRADLVRAFQSAAGFAGPRRHLTYVVAASGRVSFDATANAVKRNQHAAVVRVPVRAEDPPPKSREPLYPLFVDVESLCGR